MMANVTADWFRIKTDLESYEGTGVVPLVGVAASLCGGRFEQAEGLPQRTIAFALQSSLLAQAVESRLVAIDS
jgi:hypothetical protein